jgi:hypothetical protein
MTTLQALQDERARQDKLWGGPEHDDNHARSDWEDFIIKQLGGLSKSDNRYHYLRQFTKIAALAGAAIESDRRIEKLPIPVSIYQNWVNMAQGMELPNKTPGQWRKAIEVILERFYDELEFQMIGVLAVAAMEQFK